MTGERVARQIRWDRVQLAWAVLGLCGLLAVGVWGVHHRSPADGWQEATHPSPPPSLFQPSPFQPFSDGR
ncbi:hypothetical protein [Kitasatospora sp. NPDC057198]|uniref:hypothetical protein n=1 Tax=Kitasatospora sp. NPDC057198 TaxID=3346046 RepID=UPI0036441850